MSVYLLKNELVTYVTHSHQNFNLLMFAYTVCVDDSSRKQNRKFHVKKTRCAFKPVFSVSRTKLCLDAEGEEIDLSDKPALAEPRVFGSIRIYGKSCVVSDLLKLILTNASLLAGFFNFSSRS